MTGGCLCGAVRYEVSGEPVIASKCYCRDCQKETGSGHLCVVCFPESAVSSTGTIQTFDRSGGSGKNVTRSFCPICGTTLWGRAGQSPGTINIRAGTLDDSDDVELRVAVFCKSARSWDLPPDGLPQFPELPPGYE